MPRKLVIVGFHLADRSAHYFNELYGHRNAARALGLDARILVPRDAPIELATQLAAQRALEPVPALAAPNAGDLFNAIEGFFESVDALDALWRTIEAHGLGRHDVLLFTSGYPVVIAGLGRWIASRRPSARPSVFFRVEIGNQFIDHQTQRYGAAAVFFRMACADLRTRDGNERVYLIGDTPEITRKAGRAGARRVFETTVPKFLPPVFRALAPAGPSPTLYVHVNVRSGAVGAALPAIVAGIRAKHPDLQCIVKSSGLDLEARARLEDELAPFATLLPSEQSTDDYLANFRECTVALLAYDAPAFYRDASSGVFVEAAAFGVPVVVPGNTWMAGELAAGRAAGAVFDETEPSSIVYALSLVLRDSERFKAAARSAAGAMRTRHSSTRYIQTMLAIAKEKPDMLLRYRAGDEIDFSDAADSRCFMHSGWARTESWGVWTSASTATLSLRLHGSGSLVMDSFVRPFLTQEHRSIAVSVRIGARTLAVWAFDVDDQDSYNAQWRRVAIPAEAARELQNGHLLSFTIDAPKSPASLGISNDERELGLGFIKLVTAES